MDVERGQRLDELYHSASEYAAADRAVFLQVESRLTKKCRPPTGMRHGMFAQPPEIVQRLQYSDLRVFAQTGVNGPIG